MSLFIECVGPKNYTIKCKLLRTFKIVVKINICEIYVLKNLKMTFIAISWRKQHML